MTVMALKGCTHEPLAHYLKALGVFRIVSSQKDAAARGWWEAGTFHLDSILDQAALVQFWLSEYRPTPIVAPWNAGSGFYEGDRILGRDTIRANEDPRFQEYRETIEAILTWPELPPIGQTLGEMLGQVKEAATLKEGLAKVDLSLLAEAVEAGVQTAAEALHLDNPLTLTIRDLSDRIADAKRRAVLNHDKETACIAALRECKKLRTKAKDLSRGAAKQELVEACRNRLGPRAVEWLDAAVAVAGDGRLLFPPMLGSGGNEGRLDYTTAFMDRIHEVLLGGLSIGDSEELLRNALFTEFASGLVIASVGQHDPGRAGGYNQGTGTSGIEAKDFLINPWNFVLSMEGAAAWVGGAARRHDTRVSSLLCSPFTVRTSPVGYSSASTLDGRASRAEVWVPLWERPVGYPELRAFLAEGRADVAGRNAANGIEFAEAVAGLGVDRGIEEFVRYSLLKRRGDSYVAVPVGRFPARYRAESDVIRDLHSPLRALDRFLRAFGDQGPPARFMTARRAIDDALFEVLRQGGPQRVKALVIAIGRMERLLTQRNRQNKPKLSAPLKGLGPEWLLASDDGSLEVRLAASLISITGDRKVGPLRGNLASSDPEKPWKWAVGEGQRTWVGNTLCDRMSNVLQRRLVDAERLGCEVLPLRGVIGVCTEDVTAFINGEVDDAVLEDLLFGFSWVDMWHPSASAVLADVARRWRHPIRQRPVDRTWMALKLLFVPGSLNTPSGSVVVRPETSIVPLLRAGRVQDAGKIAHRRLFVSGLSPKGVSYPNGPHGPRIAAALLFPTSNLRGVMLGSLTPGGG